MRQAVISLLFLLPSLATACSRDSDGQPATAPIIEAPEAISAVRECQDSVSPCAEASTGFDGETLAAFLEKIPPLVDSGFGPDEIAQIVDATEQLSIDDERQFSFSIRYRGEDVALRTFLFVDDADVFDIFFLTIPELANEIEQEMIEFGEGLGQ